MALSGCARFASAGQSDPGENPSQGVIIDPLGGSPPPTFFKPASPLREATPLPSLITPEPSPTVPSATPTIPTFTPTLEPSPTLTPTWSFQEAGYVNAPVLLYHHISDDNPGNRYYVTVKDFRRQMKYLHGHGYTTIPISQLVEVLIHGGELPSRPIVITFDDGDLDVYQNAYPIMQEFGMVGVLYIVANRLESQYYMNADQLRELTNAGWEIGSHGMSHIDLTVNHDLVRQEILQSRLDLENILGVPVKTFAYPFGMADDYIYEKTQDYGYRAGAGLGTSSEHYWSTMYYLSRKEVHDDFTIEDFASLLPWQ